MKDKKTEKLASASLAPLRVLLASVPGAMADVQARLQKKTGKAFHRNNIAQWLHPDAKRRRQPYLGVGLVLLEIQAELNEQGHEAAAPEIPAMGKRRPAVDGAARQPRRLRGEQGRGKNV